LSFSIQILTVFVKTFYRDESDSEDYTIRYAHYKGSDSGPPFKIKNTGYELSRSGKLNRLKNNKAKYTYSTEPFRIMLAREEVDISSQVSKFLPLL
jgi:hypothetical protein